MVPVNDDGHLEVLYLNSGCYIPGFAYGIQCVTRLSQLNYTSFSYVPNLVEAPWSDITTPISSKA
jgi:hypothetical protein